MWEKEEQRSERAFRRKAETSDTELATTRPKTRSARGSVLPRPAPPSSKSWWKRQKAKKVVNLIPTQVGSSLSTVLPEQLQSPLLTAEWENRLKQIEHGETSADDFIGDITAMVDDLVKNYEVVKGSEILFPSGREELGKCPRCGGSVTESKKGYFCERNDCRFGLWHDNKFLTGKKINLTRKMVMSLLKDGRAYVSGIFSEKTGKSYDAFIRLEDDGTHAIYKLEFDKENKA